MKHPPKLVCSLVYGHNAWVVGSGAKEGSENPRDWDVLVPFQNWFEACFLIPKNAYPNTFGGWKCETDEGFVDVWPGDLGSFFLLSAAKFAWHPKSGIRLEKK